MAINRSGGPAVYVSLLPEDVQNKCQLQEAHENTQVRTHTNIKITSLTFALKGRSGPRSSIAIATAGPSGLFLSRALNI